MIYVGVAFVAVLLISVTIVMMRDRPEQRPVARDEFAPTPIEPAASAPVVPTVGRDVHGSSRVDRPATARPTHPTRLPSGVRVPPGRENRRMIL